MIDVCVVGLGAIGTFYALVLEKSGQARVTAVCRSNYHILSAAGKGVTVHADSLGVFQHWKPYRVVSKAEEAADRKYQFIICTTKALPDVVTTPKLLGPLLTHTDTFVLIQNGLDIHLDLQKARPDADVISCCAWIDVMPLDGGRVVEQTGPDKLISGLHAYLPSHHAPLRAARGRTVLSAFDELLVAGGAGSETVVEIDAARWRKVLWNVTFSTLCTIVRQPVADILCIRVLDVMVPTIRGLMAEVLAVARKAGISEEQLPAQAADDVIERCLDMYSDQRTEAPSRFKPSMLLDLEAGRPTEVEVIVGAIVRAAEAHAVDIPRLNTVYAQLRVIQEQLMRQRTRA